MQGVVGVIQKALEDSPAPEAPEPQQLMSLAAGYDVAVQPDVPPHQAQQLVDLAQTNPAAFIRMMEWYQQRFNEVQAQVFAQTSMNPVFQGATSSSSRRRPRQRALKPPPMATLQLPASLQRVDRSLLAQWPALPDR